MTSNEEEEEQTQISFRDQAWLETFPLNKDSVMDYFSRSSFYDGTCLNEQIKMQRLDPKTIQNRTGKEYFIEHVIPPESEQGNPPNIFVIRKQNRVSTKNVEHLSSYYILNGTAFQSPNIRTVCSSTLRASLYHVSNSFKEISSYSQFDPYLGYIWNFDKKKTTASQLNYIAPKSPFEVEKAKETQVQVEKMIENLASIYAPMSQTEVH